MLKNLEKKANKQLLKSFENLELPVLKFLPAPEHTKADLTTNWSMSCCKLLKKKSATTSRKC